MIALAGVAGKSLPQEGPEGYAVKPAMESYDVVIIGSGPAGLGAAFELLARRPELSVLVMDKNE